MKYIKSMAQQSLCLLLALYIGLFMNGAVFSVGLKVTRKILPSGKELQRLLNWSLRTGTFFLLRMLPCLADVWRILATLVVLFPPPPAIT
jgi:KDO II ethanolaminephosphotransferase